MSFEDLLAIASKPKCKTCDFVENLENPLRDEVKAAIAKPIYSDEALARGLAKIESPMPKPKKEAIRNHRSQGHAS